MKKFSAVYWWLFIVYLSCKWVFRVHLGCRVWYGGKKYLVLDGTRLYSWRLDRLDNGDEGWVREWNCSKVLSIENLWHSFRMGYRFYMRNWFSIWKNQGIKPWMRACKIW